MGRASARGVDAMIAVVEPGMRSVQTAARVQRLAEDIGIRRTLVVMNKIRNQHDRDVLRRALGEQVILGELPYCAHLASADLEGSPIDIRKEPLAGAINSIVESLEKQLNGSKATT